MTNLNSYSNIYADLAQSAYLRRRGFDGELYNFADGLTHVQQQSLAKGEMLFRLVFRVPGMRLVVIRVGCFFSRV
jgi:hypothetical protein